MNSALDDRFRLSAEKARELAREFGTPLYVIGEEALRSRVRRYRAAFEAAAPGSEITFASKANSTLAVLKIAYAEGCLIDCASEGEMRAALAAGVPAAKMHLHGNNKLVSELEFAIEIGIGQIVLDNFEEIELLAGLPGAKPRCMIRLAPGVDPKTNAKISTGQADTKFGFNIVDGSGERALLRALELGVEVDGFHCHVGSQLLDPEAQVSGGQLLAEFAAQMRARHGFETQVLNVGGGMGIRYTEDDEPMAPEDYCRMICEGIGSALEGSGLNPKLVQEPGRSIIGEAGVTLYEVGAVKTVPAAQGPRTYVSVDGGLSDNPRPALYGSPYPVEAISGDGRELGEPRAMTVSGRHCETDRLFVDKMLPGDLQRGDLLQVLCTGAYNSAMASNYNRFPRPATVLVRGDGRAQVVQHRESWDQVLAREALPEGLS
jgi:diaminopimelate decarboxylase